MKRALTTIHNLSRLLHVIAGISLVFLMLLTLMDVTLRAFGRPIPGTYELVGFAGALAIGLTMPITSWRRGHVYVDALLVRFSPAGRNAFHIATRLLAVALFLLITWNLVRAGLSLKADGSVSQTLAIPFYPVVFGVAVAAFLQAVVLAAHVVKIVRGEYE